MSKIDIEEIESVLIRNKIEPIRALSIIKELQTIVEEIKNDKDTTPKQKWEYVIVLQDKERVLTDKELVGWVVQQPLDADTGLVLSKLQDAARDQNEVASKKKNRIVDIGDIFRYLKSKFIKEKNVRIKTKEPVRVLITS